MKKKPVNFQITTRGTLETVTVKDLDSNWSVTKTNVQQPTIEIPANVSNIEVYYRLNSCLDMLYDLTCTGVTNLQVLELSSGDRRVRFTCTIDRSVAEHTTTASWASGPC